MERMTCACCGYLTTCSWLDHPRHEEPLAVCAVCAGADMPTILADLPSSHHSAAQGFARIANAIADAHGVAYRDALTGALLGDGPASGTYEAMD